MSQLRSCYFCGAVGDSLREYDLAPDDTVPEGSHSAVLCSTCHGKLRRVLEPLTDGSSDEGSGDSVREPSSTQSITFGGESDSGGAADSATTAGDDPGDATGTAADADADVDAESETTTDDDGTASDPDDGTTESSDEPDVPDQYYKVLRLLQNREFPMERAELTTLVTAAYDVSEPQCERVLETAIDRGVLVEDGSTLDLGRN